jgi:uncharacterized protein (TIGR02594 family)
MNITAFDLAQRFVGIKEIAGAIKDNPLILAMLQLDNNWPEHDEVPWCSAFCNFICFMLRLPRSKKLDARSWLEVGRAIVGKELKVGFDIVILAREGDPNAGHVGFYAGLDEYSANAKQIQLLGGNQGNSVNVSPFPTGRIIGLRRLYESI